MGELFDFLIVVVVVLYIIRLIARILIPRLFQSLVNKAQQQQQNHQQNYTRNTNTTEKIKVDYIPQTPKSKIPDSEGDFIDYEEIK